MSRTMITVAELDKRYHLSANWSSYKQRTIRELAYPDLLPEQPTF
jgi:hypothetical protein